MHKNVERVVRYFAPPDIFDDADFKELANQVRLLMSKAPSYLRPLLMLFFALPLPSFFGHDRVIGFLSRKLGGPKLSLAQHWIVEGLAMPFCLAIYSHPKVLAVLGVVEGQYIRPCPPDQPCATAPPVVPTLDASALPDDGVEVDIVIVGSGPGGSAPALPLARAGYKVLICEAGEVPQPGRIHSTYDAAYRIYDHGGLTTGFSPDLQALPNFGAINLGGTANINMGTCLPPSDETVRAMGLDPHVFAGYCAQVETLLSVMPAERALMGKHNAVMERGFAALGLKMKPIPRNAINTGGASGNINGTNLQKLTPERTLLPKAVRAGATVVVGCPVERVLMDQGRAVGVLVNARGRRIKIMARHAVILAAGTLKTPLILKRSGFTHPAIGRCGFIPANSSVIGEMPEVINSYLGIEQAFVCRDHEEQGIVYESVATTAAMTAPQLVGNGYERWVQMRRFNRFVQAGFIVDLNRSAWQVTEYRGDPLMTFRLHPEDGELAKQAFLVVIEALFKAGATRVYLTGVGWFEGFAEAKAAVEAMDIAKLHLISVHFIGSCAMGEDPKKFAVDLNGLVRDTLNLYVTDGSVLPVAVGVNPQETIMANALRIARGITGGDA